MIDANCHLTFDALWANRVEIIARAKAVGVEATVVTTDTCSTGRIKRLEQASFEGHPVAAGWHPLFEAPSNAIDTLDQLLSLHSSWGVGEIGLDTRRGACDPTLFEQQLTLASGRFCVIHAVGPGALDQALQVVKRSDNGARGMVHAFGGSWEQAKQWLDLGWNLSVGGPVTRSNAHRIHRWVSKIPLDALLLESDAPDLAPQDWSGPNEPASLASVASAVSVLKSVPVDLIKSATQDNALRWLRG